MKPIILHSDKFLDTIQFGKIRWAGIMLFPFIVLRESEKGLNIYKSRVVHEKIHFKQCLETLILGFYILYVLMFVWNFFKYDFNSRKAYRSIPFELEAYKFDKNQNYLETRKPYRWLDL